MWNWNGILRNGVGGDHQGAVPDGQLCSGGLTEGGRYAALDAPGGFQAGVQVTAGGSAIGGWTVGLAFPDSQTVDSIWNASLGGSGSDVTATNVAYNGSLGAGQSTQFGFLGSWNGTTNDPPALTCTAS